MKIHYVAVIIVLALMIVMPAGALQGGGDDIAVQTVQSVSLQPTNVVGASPSNLTGLDVLFDESHDEHNYLDDTDPNNHDDAWSFREWRAVLVNMGANVKKLQTGPIDAVNLSGNEILVISCPRTTFTIQEVIAIGTFVNNGGGLLLITEAGGTGYQCSGILNGISSQFSIYMNNVSAPVSTPSIVSHQVTKDVNSVSFRFSDNLTVVPGSSFPLITSGPGGSSILMAGSEHGLGRVIVIGDTNVWADNFNGMITPDNGQLAVNTISWLGHVNIVSNPTGIAVFRPASGYWYFDNNLDGIVNKSIRFGGSTDQIIAGDWQGTGTDGIAIFRPASGYWYFDYNLDGIVDKSIRYGGAGDKIATGDWDNDGKDGIALFRPVSGYWYFDNNLDGVVDKSFRYGGSTDQVITGKWA